eukprot:jgi/Botrbrau1/14985/Bobra.0018s0085.1
MKNSEVDIQERGDKGRCMIAADNWTVGETIISVAPYAAVLYGEQADIRCHHSFQIPNTRLRCGGCKFAKYKDKTAQKAAWAVHKAECRALQGCAPRIPPATIRLAAHVFWRRAREEKAASTSEPGPWDTYSAVEGLRDHWHKLTDERKATFAQMGFLVRQYMAGGDTPEGELPSVEEAAHLLARFSANNHTICDQEMRPIGVGVYPLAAMANHSCNPNAIQCFDDSGSITFKAILPVNRGNEVCIAYTELAAPRPERRQALLSSYFFDIDEGEEQPGWQSLGHLQGTNLEIAVSSKPPVLGWRDEMMTAICDSSGKVIPENGLLLLRQIPAGIAFMDEDDLEDFEEDLKGLKAGSSCGTAGPSGEETSREQASGPTKRPRQEGQDPPEAGSSGRSHKQAAGGGHASGDRLECWGPIFQDKKQVGDEFWEHLGALVAQFRSAEDAQRAKNWTEAIAAAQAAKRLAQGHDRRTSGPPPLTLGPSHVLVMRLEEMIMHSCIQASSSQKQDLWKEALASAHSLTPFVERIYPLLWPTTGLQHAAVAKLENYLGNGKAARAALLSALRILTVTHRSSSPPVKEMRELEMELREEERRGGVDPDTDLLVGLMDDMHTMNANGGMAWGEAGWGFG